MQLFMNGVSKHEEFCTYIANEFPFSKKTVANNTKNIVAWLKFSDKSAANNNVLINTTEPFLKVISIAGFGYEYTAL